MAFNTLGDMVAFLPHVLAILIFVMAFIALYTMIRVVFFMGKLDRRLYGFLKILLVVDFKFRLDLLGGEHCGQQDPTKTKNHENA
jgi:hypothetical protein